jgi:hypothetical protein
MQVLAKDHGVARRKPDGIFHDLCLFADQVVPSI